MRAAETRREVIDRAGASARKTLYYTLRGNGLIFQKVGKIIKIVF